MNSQFKFKPDKIKYLSNVDTLDSKHKKFMNEINQKRDDVDNKSEELIKLKKSPIFYPTEKIACANGKFPGRPTPLKDGRVHKYLNMYLAIYCHNSLNI